MQPDGFASIVAPSACAQIIRDSCLLDDGLGFITRTFTTASDSACSEPMESILVQSVTRRYTPQAGSRTGPSKLPPQIPAGETGTGKRLLPHYQLRDALQTSTVLQKAGAVRCPR